MIDTISIFGLLLFLVFLLWLGQYLNTKLINEDMLDSCAKQHNVYECELVSVPKGKTVVGQIHGVNGEPIDVPKELKK
jgi:hypothetical protein